MIYLIGGAPRVGKSVIAEHIANTQGIQLVKLDDVCRDMCRNLPPAEQATLFPCPSFSGDPSKNVLPPQQRVELQLLEAVTLRGEIDRLIANYHEQQKNLIVEGVYLLPSHTGYLIERYGKDALRCVFIGCTNEDCILDGMNRNTAPDDWLKESSASVRQQVAHFVAAFSQVTKRESARHDLDYIERSFDFEQDTLLVLQHLLR